MVAKKRAVGLVSEKSEDELFKLLGTRILITPDEDEESKLFVPEGARQPKGVGFVVHIGHEVTLVKVGQKVLYPPVTGTFVMIEERVLVLVPEQQIVAINV